MRQFLAQEQFLGFVTVAKDAKVPDLHKALWKYVQQEATNELTGRDGHDLLFSVIAVIAPFEGYETVFHFEDSVVGNSYAMRISAEILDHGRWVAEGRFTVNDPFFLVAGIDQ